MIYFALITCFPICIEISRFIDDNSRENSFQMLVLRNELFKLYYVKKKCFSNFLQIIFSELRKLKNIMY